MPILPLGKCKHQGRRPHSEGKFESRSRMIRSWPRQYLHTEHRKESKGKGTLVWVEEIKQSTMLVRGGKMLKPHRHCRGFLLVVLSMKYWVMEVTGVYPKRRVDRAWGWLRQQA